MVTPALAGGLVAVLAATTAAVTTTGAATAAPTQAYPPDSDFEKVTLNSSPGEPMDLAVLPDRRVLHTTRAGQIWMNHPDTGRNILAGELDVYRHDEEGLQSVAVDPDFGKTNNWVYLYYSPPMDTPVDNPSTPKNEGDAPESGTEADWAKFRGKLTLSRFKLAGNKLNLNSEQKIIDVPVDRGICCHVGGDIVFDGKGNLFLSTGDDTNPFSSGGFSPLDDRAGRNPAFDARRTAGNTNDLRGKLLRITPGQKGGYTVPKGNLFRAGTPKTRPEIYSMGWRNPFRIEYNRKTKELYVADYSPDSAKSDPNRGPAGTGKWAVVTKPGNYGWPYCATSEEPYTDWDFATNSSGGAFDCDAPKNDSRHNTGQTTLPRVEHPDLWYTKSKSPLFPDLGTGGIGPMAGPAYVFNQAASKNYNKIAWPKEYAGKPLFYEWTRDYIKALSNTEDGVVIDPVVSSIVTDNPMDMEFGPDGALYVLEYGDGYFSENPEAQLSRIDYIGRTGNHSPVPKISAEVDHGKAPLKVHFSSAGSEDPDGDRVEYEWDFNNDGKVDSTATNPVYTFKKTGVFRPTLKVTDVRGQVRQKSASADVKITVGNDTPNVKLIKPVDGSTFRFGDTVDFEVQVTDDQPVDCTKVEVNYILGHDSHGHPITTAKGCSGSIKTSLAEGHEGEKNLTGVFVASYTDPGGNGVPPLTGTDEVVLRPVD